MTTWIPLVDLTFKSTLVLAIAWLAAFVLRRRSAAARHIVWTAASAALLALPLLSLSLPTMHHPLANAILPAANPITFHTPSTAAIMPDPLAHRTQQRTASAPPAPAPAFDPRTAMVFLWAAGAALSLVQMMAAYIAVWRLRRNARPLPHDTFALDVAEPVSI